MNDIIIPKSLEDYCKVREDVIRYINEAHKMLEVADEKLKQVHRYGLIYGAKPALSGENTIKQMDISLWRAAFDITGFRQVMDAKAVKDFENSLNVNPPEFTIDNIRSTFISVSQDSSEMFSRGLVNIFRLFSPNHKTNTKEPFKINKKAIIPYMVSNFYGMEISRRSADEINDLDRVMKTLDDKKHHPRELETLINAQFKHGKIYEDDYYKMRGYKNGNLHVEFKRDDLINKANRVIADYYGAALK